VKHCTANADRDPWKGEKIVYVYSPYLMATWVDKGTE
jgi:hypothetical protein